jgi:hypothetical protein
VCILQLWRVGCVIFNFSRKSYDLTKNCFGLATRVSVLGIQRVLVLGIQRVLVLGIQRVLVLGIQRVFQFLTYACFIFGHTTHVLILSTRVSILGIQHVSFWGI